MKDIIIVDLDGTLADGRWRLHLLPTKDRHLTESWREFNAAAGGDDPIWSTIDVVKGLQRAGYFIIVLTGRSNSAEAITRVWLDNIGLKPDLLKMRDHSDNRKDTIIKEEFLRQVGLHRIVCAFDDSPEVIRHFRSLGITTYAVVEYDNLHEREDLKSHGVDK